MAKGFFLLYVVVLLKRLLPFQFGNLAWIQGFVAASIYNTAFPLGGVGFLLLAALIAPDRPTGVQQVAQVQTGLRTLRDRIELVCNSEDLAEACAGLRKPVAQRASALPLPQARQESLAGIDRESSKLPSQLQAQRNSLRSEASKEMLGTLVLSLVLARILACG